MKKHIIYDSSIQFIKSHFKILNVGDVHGDFSKLNQLIAKKKPDIVLQCGDFGWWPRLDKINNESAAIGMYSRQPIKRKLKIVKPQGTKIYWCDGNHEEHDSLPQDGNIHEKSKDIFFCSRGSTISLPDGRVVLFAGGAASVDKDLRTPGRDWFPQENITHTQLDYMLSHRKVDIVISHTCPTYFELIKSAELQQAKTKQLDSNRYALDRVFEKYSPSLWFFGHWHTEVTGRTDNTLWRGFDYPGHIGRWWDWLPMI